MSTRTRPEPTSSPSQASVPSPPPLTPGERLERAQVSEALKKLARNDTPTKEERHALTRFERRKEEEARWKHYRTIPSKHYKEMSGRPARTLINQNAQWGIPCAGRTVDLQMLLRWIHDFIADNSHRLLAEDRTTDVAAEALSRYRTALAKREELAAAELDGSLMPRKEIEELMGKCAARLVRALSLVENAIATELSVWLADPAVRDMPADKRASLVREFVARTSADVRRMEIQSVEEMLGSGDHADDDEERDGGEDGGDHDDDSHSAA